MNPRVGAVGLIYYAEKSVLLIVFARDNVLHALGAVIEVYEILRVGRGCKVARDYLVAVFVARPEEELVVLVGNEADVAAVKVCAVVNAGVVRPGRGFIEHRGDERSLALVVDADCHVAGGAAAGVAGHADAGFVDIRQGAGKLNRSVEADCGGVESVCVGALGVAVAVHINCYNDIAAAGVLNGVKILHFLVVVPALNGDYRGSRSFGGSVCGLIEQRAYLVAGAVYKTQLGNLDASPAALNG